MLPFLLYHVQSDTDSIGAHRWRQTHEPGSLRYGVLLVSILHPFHAAPEEPAIYIQHP